MKSRNTSIYRIKSINSGFSLLEVMIALFVLSIGLLGLAALQSVALKSNHSAYHRSQATFLAYDIMDRMRANKNAAKAGNYNVEMGANPSGSGSLAANDVSDWVNNHVAQLLPAGDGSINCDNQGMCLVIVQWDESRAGGTATGGDDTAEFELEAEI
ncbi:type IV pilus assembly protein PilV [Methylohalomonas lacus]|uniref:Type IV pilus assembly protein PilV n=1 Tax=Methylohalomonas lacus TaxID=398773 RepID=A0AAE3HIH1_9GAMM|nr:type IV pilus modification protein PilV [Methylohalomonas lacus]MCS3902961.1 type IV pilus assembly protein PilV [Methylohalomonas lacus]